MLPKNGGKQQNIWEAILNNRAGQYIDIILKL